MSTNYITKKAGQASRLNQKTTISKVSLKKERYLKHLKERSQKMALLFQIWIRFSFFLGGGWKKYKQ